MADVSNFIIPESNFDGIENITRGLQRKQEMDVRKQEHEQAQRASMSKMLQQYADPKEHLSGAPTDPQVIKGFADMFDEGIKLINQNKGMTHDMLMLALSPKASQLAQYATKAKNIKGNIKNWITKVPEGEGYDKARLEEAALRAAFYDDNGSQKDINNVDDTKNWLIEAEQKFPDEVTTTKGLDTWLAKKKLEPGTTSITRINSRGGREKKTVSTNAYQFATLGVDEKGIHTGEFEPVYEIPTEEGQAILGENGKPVKVVPDAVFQSVIRDVPSMDTYLRGQVMKAIKSGEFTDKNGKPLDINSPQAHNLAKAILYEEMNLRTMGSLKYVEEQKANPVVHVRVNTGSASDRKNAQTQSDTHEALNQTDADPNGNIDVTSYLGGVNFLVNSKGQRKAQSKVVYNFKDKTFTYEVPDPNDDSGTKSITKKASLAQMKTMAKTINPTGDVSFLDGFGTYKRKDEEKKPEEKKMTLAERMKAAKK